ncbi:NfeD family protein [Chloroflexota bacterium]
MMTGRLILAILSTLLEEAAIVAVVQLGLPRLDVYIPLPGLIGLMVVWGVFSVFTYRVGSRALRKKPMVGLPEMAGSKGKVISTLNPKGVIKIGVELWEATSAGRKINVGTEVQVMRRDGLTLIVSKTGKTGVKPC